MGIITVIVAFGLSSLTYNYFFYLISENNSNL